MIDVAIRPYRMSDVDVMLEAIRESAAELSPWMPWCHAAYSRDDGERWLQEQLAAFERRTAFQFAVVMADGHYCGGCGLNGMDHENRRANLGYWTRSSMTRRGIAASAVRLVHEWAFENTDLIRLEVVIAVENRASRRVAEKTGAHREGILRNRLVLHGRAHDAVMFSFAREMGNGETRRTEPHRTGTTAA